MPLTHRTERIAEQIREELSQMLATEVSDPGVGLVTVTRVKVTADLSLARIYWTIIGDSVERKKTDKALKRTIPYVRHLLASRLTLRRVPDLAFQFDESVAAQDRIERILEELRREDESRAAEVAATAPSVADGAEVGAEAATDRVDSATGHAADHTREAADGADDAENAEDDTEGGARRR